METSKRQRVACKGGGGDCFIQNDEGGYEAGDGCGPCKLQPCPNAAICEEKALPKWMLSNHNGRCTECDVVIGQDLVFTQDNAECGVCLEIATLQVRFPSCKRHSTCITCFRRITNYGTRPEVENVDGNGVPDEDENDVPEEEESMDENEEDINLCIEFKCPFCRDEKVKKEWEGSRV